MLQQNKLSTDTSQRPQNNRRDCRCKTFAFSAIMILISCYLMAQESNIDRFENELKEQQQEYRDIQKEKKERPLIIESFCKNLSQSNTSWQMTAEEIQTLKNKGAFGYSELIKVILISKKIEKSPDEIVKRRNRGETFLSISERYKLDYGKIKSETKEIMASRKVER